MRDIGTAVNTRAFSAGVGTIVFAIGLVWLIWQGVASRREFQGQAHPASDECAYPIKGFELKRKVLTQGESEVLIVHLARYDSVVTENASAQLRSPAPDCVVTVRLLAPGFDYEPRDGNRKVALRWTGSIERVSWVIAPKALGNQAIIVEVERDQLRIDFRIVSLLGLSAWQATLLSWLAAFLGPALTLPWLLSKVGKNRKGAAN